MDVKQSIASEEGSTEQINRSIALKKVRATVTAERCSKELWESRSLRKDAKGVKKIPGLEVSALKEVIGVFWESRAPV